MTDQDQKDVTDLADVQGISQEQAEAILTPEQREALEAGEDIELTEEQSVDLANWGGDTPIPDDSTPSEEEVKKAEDEAKEPEETEMRIDEIPAGCIKLPKGTDMVEFVQKVYSLSKPQGLGHTKFTPGELPEAEAKQILARHNQDSKIAVSLDYVNGRACKMTVHRHADGTLYIRRSWFDHTFDETKELFKAFGIKVGDAERHEMEELVEEQREQNPFEAQAGENE